MTLLVIESDVRRVWAALRCIDAASGQTIDAALRVASPGTRWQRNRSGLHVLTTLDPPALSAARRQQIAAHESAFDVLPAVDALNLPVDVSDPLGRWLPRRATLALPRALADLPRPVELSLDPSPSAPLRPTWAVLRVSTRRAGRPQANVVLRLTSADGSRTLGRGLSDARGEALVVAAGVAQMTIGGGALVFEPQVDAELVATFDPATPDGQPVDPDAVALRNDLPRTRVNCQLASGRTQALRIDLP